MPVPNYYSEKPEKTIGQVGFNKVTAAQFASEIKAKTKDRILAISILTTLIIEQGSSEDGKRILKYYNNNVSGIQTDGGRWGRYGDTRMDDLISYTYVTQDSLTTRRFAGFNSRLDFIEFMIIRWGQIVKEMNVKDSDSYTKAYKYKWWLGVNSDEQVIQQLKKDYGAQAFTVLKQKDAALARIWKEADQILKISKEGDVGDSVKITDAIITVAKSFLQDGKDVSFGATTAVYRGKTIYPTTFNTSSKGREVLSEMEKYSPQIKGGGVESEAVFNRSTWCNHYCRMVWAKAYDSLGKSDLSKFITEKLVWTNGPDASLRSHVEAAGTFKTGDMPTTGAIFNAGWSATPNGPLEGGHVGIVIDYDIDAKKMTIIEGNGNTGVRIGFIEGWPFGKKRGERFTLSPKYAGVTKYGESYGFIYPPETEPAVFNSTTINGINSLFSPRNIIYIKDLFLNRINFSDTIKNVSAFVGDNFRI